MPMLGVMTVKYGVPDLQRAKEWYASVLGLRPYFDEKFYVGFEVAGYELGLDPDSAPGGEGVVAYWGVKDLQAEYQRLLGLGGRAGEAPKEVGEGIWVATVLDPWGNAFGLIHNPHFKLPR